MGVGISLDRLAGAVAACGGMGTISTAFCGFQELYEGGRAVLEATNREWQ